jgi:vitamin B12 transporter
VYLWNGTKAINRLDFSDFRGDTYLNTGKQTNSGFEMGLDIKLAEQWQFHTNLTYNRGTLEYSPQFLDVAKTKNNHVQLYSTGAFLIGATETPDLVRRPENITNTSLVYTPSSAWQITADVRTVSSRSDVFYNPSLGPFGALGRNTTGGFALFNLSGNWKMRSNVNVQINCFNLFDKEYTELNGFATRGRSLFASIRYQF